MIRKKSSKINSSMKRTVTESKKGRTTSTSFKSKATGTRSTTSFNSKTGKISKYVTTKVGSFFKRKKVK